MSAEGSRVAVLGASGFVGSAVTSALRERQIEVRPIRSPRLVEPLPPYDHATAVADLIDVIGGCHAVVNAAGMADSTRSNGAPMRGANTLLPGCIAEAARSLNIRFVHISSAAVQGPREELDSSVDIAPFSPYSRSKADGEAVVLNSRADGIVYRPPGVHGPNRSLTRTVARIASSPLSSVAGAGNEPSANALITNVGDAIAHLATTASPPPTIVHHPSEGLTTAALLRALGGREPLHVPVALARGVLAVARALGRAQPPVMAHTRRLEMLWFGQRQASSWLQDDGWAPPHGLQEWTRLGETLRADTQRKRTA